jgi:hypothetical protein
MSKKALALLGSALVLVVNACDRTEPVAPGAAVVERSPASAQSGGDDPGLAGLLAANERLAARGLNIRAEAIEFFTIGVGRPSNRIHQQPFRWVPNDPRRLADGENITYLVDLSDGRTASGLSKTETEAAIDAGLATWDASQPLEKVDLVKRADPGVDPDIYDAFFGFGGFGNPFLADIVNAGWLPRAFFEAVGGPGGGRGILAFSVTFIFVNEDGSPSDINGDNYLDTALNEVYYNDTFGDRRDDRAGNPWGINVVLPGIDVETVALHENGHSLELGHFGPPPAAVMNPVYAGLRHTPFAADLSGMNAVWSSWANP